MLSRRDLILAAAAAPVAAEESARLYRDLLRWPSTDGAERVVKSARDWERRRREILAAMERVMGPLPRPEHREPLDVRVVSEVHTERYVRRKLSYATVPGERVPAYLLLPSGAGKGKRPAALCLHQTTPLGKDEPVGLGGSANLHYAHELADRGYVCLVPEYATFGENQVDVYARGWASGSMKAIWDNIRGVDLLQSLPEVDSKRIGCLGHSLGGHNTLFTSVFEPRIRALVSNCGFTAFHRYFGGDLTGWTGPRYMPRIKTQFPTPDRMPFEFHDVVAALAPRAFLAIAPLRDANFDVAGVREVMAAARPVYALLGHAERLEALYPDCAHDWPPDMREAAYRWLDRWLRK